MECTAHLALHVKVPANKDDIVCRYGDPERIKEKVAEALEEIKRIDEGKLIASGFIASETVSFYCPCGENNKRKVKLLKDKQVISCFNPRCCEIFNFERDTESFVRQIYVITCEKCNMQKHIPKKQVENLRADQPIEFSCGGCEDRIFIQWRLKQTQKH